MKIEPISVMITEESMQAYEQLYKEYHEKAGRLGEEYLKKLDILNRRFEDKKANKDEFPFIKPDFEKLGESYFKKKAKYVEPEVNLREKYTDCEKYLPKDDLDVILQLLENNFNGYVPNWAKIAMTTQLLLVESPTENGDKSPTENGDKSPSEDGDKSPSENDDKSPSENDDKSPSENDDKSPSENGDKSLSEDGDKSPSENDDKSPSEDGDKSPNKTGNKSQNKGSNKKVLEWDTDRKLEAFCKAIKEIRLQREMSLEDIGDILDYTRQNISKIENGKLKTFPAKKIPIIALRLGVSPAYLLGLADQKYKPNRIECFFWEHPDILFVENNAQNTIRLIEESKQIISYVKFYREINPEDSYRFYETDLEQAQERLKTVISDIKDNELVYSLEKILNPYSARYGTAVSIIKAVSALYTMSDLANDLFTPPAHAALHPAPPKLKEDSQHAEAEPAEAEPQEI